MDSRILYGWPSSVLIDRERSWIVVDIVVVRVELKNQFTIVRKEIYFQKRIVPNKSLSKLYSFIHSYYHSPNWHCTMFIKWCQHTHQSEFPRVFPKRAESLKSLQYIQITTLLLIIKKSNLFNNSVLICMWGTFCNQTLPASDEPLNWSGHLSLSLPHLL